MTVTADKREQQIKDVPASISAFSETDLEDAGVKEVSDIIEIVPGMSMEAPRSISLVASARF